MSSRTFALVSLARARRRPSGTRRRARRERKTTHLVLLRPKVRFPACRYGDRMLFPFHHSLKARGNAASSLSRPHRYATSSIVPYCSYQAMFLWPLSWPFLSTPPIIHRAVTFHCRYLRNLNACPPAPPHPERLQRTCRNAMIHIYPPP